MRGALQEPIELSYVLRDRFRPSTRIAGTIEDQFVEDGDIREEFGEDDVYVG